MNLRALLPLAMLLCLFGNVCGASAPAQVARVIDASDVEVLWDRRVPMRDGRALAATIYRPRGAGPLPVIFIATPYIADMFHDRAMYFARRDYVFALVDVRGRGNSDGEFEPFLHDANDGYDTVEWLAAQPWSNGKVAMWGGSYSGFSQWATAKTRPPHLATIVPAAAAHPGVDFPYLQNRMSTYPARWLIFTAGRTLNGNLFASDTVFEGVARQIYRQHLPFASLQQLLGTPSKTFQRWLQHPEVDEFWDSLTPSRQEYASIDLPVLTITGYYDGDQLGALAYYRNHLAAAQAEARERHYLIIGPWDHAGTRAPRRELGGLSFGPGSMLDLDRVHQQWYDWTLKGGPKPDFLKARVAYYLPGNGNDEWRYADSLDAVSNATRTLHLSSVDGRANDVFGAGSLSEQMPRRASKPDRWVYDPLDTRPGLVAPVEQSLSGYLSQADAMNLGGAGVVYHTAPFTEATKIAGQPRLRLYLSMDVPDTDLEANLYEIQGDGKSIQLTGATLRARYRQSLRQATPVPPGKVLQYDFDQFSYFAREVAVGSRLRLVVRSPNSIHTQKNYNSGGSVAYETARDARTAHIQLHHDARYPSQLMLPIEELPAQPVTRAEPGAESPNHSVTRADPTVDAAAEDARLVAFLDAAFDAQLALSPEQMTRMGIKRGYGKLDDYTSAGRDRELALSRAQLAEMRRSFDPRKLTGQGRLSYRLFERSIAEEEERARWRDHAFSFTTMGAPTGMVPAFFINTHTVDSVADAEAYISRLRDTERVMGELAHELNQRVAKGVVEPSFVFAPIIADARKVTSGAPFGVGEDTALWADFKAKVGKLDADDATKRRLLAEAQAALTGPLRRGYDKVIATLEATSKLATSDDGVWRLPDGGAYYSSLLRRYTTTDLTADEIHQIGLEEMARIQREMRAIQVKVGFQGTLTEFFAHINAGAEFHYPNTDAGREQYLTDARAVVAEVMSKAPSMFARMPKSGLEVRAIEAWRQATAGVAFYNPGSPDGARPGVVYVNLSDLSQTLKPQLEGIACHEGAPGHHFQFNYAMQAQGLPKLRRFGGFGVYSEGWALYAEGLCKELGLYRDPYSELGRLSQDAWRAARLVVDTGLHARRWSRAQAIAYFKENTLLSDLDVTREVNRYLAHPGQATSYKIGQLKIHELRRKAEAALGAKFDLSAFHEAVLEGGSLPLDVLEEQVDEYLARAAKDGVS
jgi:putative CocE/NonD family hydrolase